MKRARPVRLTEGAGVWYIYIVEHGRYNWPRELACGSRARPVKLAEGAGVWW